MFNPLTDQFKLVETEFVNALPMVGRLISAEANESLVVYWCGEYIGSVPVRNTPVAFMSVHKSIKKVKNGYIIYHVSNRNSSVLIDGRCTTKDYYICTYNITLNFVVIDPDIFAQAYHLGKDPLNWAKEATRSAFLNYISGIEHDALLDWILRPEDPFRRSLAEETGLAVAIAGKPEIKIDLTQVQPLPGRLRGDVQDLEQIREEISLLKAELAKIRTEQKEIVEAGSEKFYNQERHKESERKDEIERKKQENALSELEREDAEKEQIHRINEQLLKTAADEMEQVLKARIQDIFESNKTSADAGKEIEELMKTLHQSLWKIMQVDDADSSKSGAPTNGTSP
jgi:hypothetical protein